MSRLAHLNSFCTSQVGLINKLVCMVEANCPRNWLAHFHAIELFSIMRFYIVWQVHCLFTRPVNFTSRSSYNVCIYIIKNVIPFPIRMDKTAPLLPLCNTRLLILRCQTPEHYTHQWISFMIGGKVLTGRSVSAHSLTLHTLSFRNCPILLVMGEPLRGNGL